MRHVLAIEAISKNKLKNFLLDLNFDAERLVDQNDERSEEKEWANRGKIEILDKIFEGINAGKFDL